MTSIFLIQSYWNWLPSEVQNHIITLANCQAIHDQNKATGLDKVLSEIRDYGKLKKRGIMDTSSSRSGAGNP